MTPVISVCVPTFEQPALAVRAIESVLQQTGCDFEIAITDDSRTDVVQAALAPYLSDSRVRYSRNERGLGAVANWNEAIRKGTGRIRKVLHHDDWLASEHALALFAEPILSGRTKLVFSACNAMSADGTVNFVHSASKDQISRLKRNANEVLFANFIGAPSVIAFDESLACRFDPAYLWISDMEFYARAVAEAGGNFEYLSEPLVNISTDLPSQISRTFELDHVRAYYEYARVYSAVAMRPEDDRRARDFLRKFSVKLNMKSYSELILRAARERQWQLALRLLRTMLENSRPAAT